MHKEQMPRENEAKKEEVATMIHRIDATVLFVRDLARCLTFYQDTLGLQVKNSDPDSVAFQLENQYLLLLEVGAAADLIRSRANAFPIKGEPRVLLAAGVEDVQPRVSNRQQHAHLFSIVFCQSRQMLKSMAG